MIKYFLTALLASSSVLAGELTTGYAYLNSPRDNVGSYKFYFDNYNDIGERQILNLYGQVETTDWSNNGYFKVAPGHKFSDKFTVYLFLEHSTGSSSQNIFQGAELIDNRYGVSLEYKVKY